MSKAKGMFIVLGLALVASLYFVVSARSEEPSVLDKVLADFVTTILQEPSYPFFRMISELGDKFGDSDCCLTCAPLDVAEKT